MDSTYEQILGDALEYAGMGWSVFPVNRDKQPLTQHGFHDATTDPGIIGNWFGENPSAGVAVATGVISGIVVLDIDLATHPEAGKFYEEQLLPDKQFSPSPFCVRTGSGGLHLYYKYPSNKSIDIRCVQAWEGHIGIDIRANGGYAVLPPSPHYSGNMYEWIQKPIPDELPEFPFRMYKTNSNHTRKITVAANPVYGEGERHSAIVSRAGMLRASGMEAEQIFENLLVINNKICNPPLEEEEIRTIAYSFNYPAYNTKVERKNGHNPEQPDDEEITRRLLAFELNDTGHAEALVFLHGDTIRYNCNSGRWLIWNKHFWKPDLAGYIYNYVIDTYRRIKTAANTLPEEDETRDKILKSASGTGNYNKIIATLKIAQAQNGTATEANEWDSNPMLLGVKNGIIDLSTGKLVDGKQEWLISKTTKIDFDEKADCPRWQQFLSEIFDDKQDIIDFIQRAIGYTLTGHNTEQYMYMLIGRGANGKSTFLKIILDLLGDYAVKTPFTTFEKRMGSSSNTNDIASLEGARFVMASESNEGMSLDEAKLKSVTGGDDIAARFLYKENFTYKPVCKIFLGTNHKPRVSDDSYGFWRRVLLIDFPKVFEENSADKGLFDKLREELPGILNWAISGCLQWQESGLMIPDTIRTATDQYRIDSNPLFSLVELCCTVDRDKPELIMDSNDIYRVYVNYCNQQNLKPNDRMSRSRFLGKFDDAYTHTTTGKGKTYYGITLNKHGLELLKMPVEDKTKTIILQKG